MRHELGLAEQKAAVVGIVAGSLKIGAGEGDDGLGRDPPAKCLDFRRAVVKLAEQKLEAQIAGSAAEVVTSDLRGLSGASILSRRARSAAAPRKRPASLEGAGQVEAEALSQKLRGERSDRAPAGGAEAVSEPHSRYGVCSSDRNPPFR